MYSVDLINLTKKWGNVTAVNDVNLHITMPNHADLDLVKRAIRR